MSLNNPGVGTREWIKRQVCCLWRRSNTLKTQVDLNTVALAQGGAGGAPPAVLATAAPANNNDLSVFPGGVAPLSGLGYFRDVPGQIDYWFMAGTWQQIATGHVV